MPQLHEFRDKVLEAAAITPGDLVLDVGCGDGLLGVTALDRFGDTGTVSFSDIRFAEYESLTGRLEQQLATRRVRRAGAYLSATR